MRMAKLALKKHDGDITKAAEDLLDNNGVIEGNLDESMNSFSSST